MVGRATLTMLRSRIDMNIPAISTTIGSRQPAWSSSPPSRVPAGRAVTLLAAVIPDSLATAPRCHKRRHVLYSLLRDSRVDQACRELTLRDGSGGAELALADGTRWRTSPLGDAGGAGACCGVVKPAGVAGAGPDRSSTSAPTAASALRTEAIRNRSSIAPTNTCSFVSV